MEDCSLLATVFQLSDCAHGGVLGLPSDVPSLAADAAFFKLESGTGCVFSSSFFTGTRSVLTKRCARFKSVTLARETLS